MSRGLVKAKKYDWKDSNLALFGSDTEKEVKKESAEQEPAWQGAGQEPGVKVWRINNFEVTDWPEEDYGEFYNGDSYIILNTYKDEESDELMYDVHFWIGKNSSQDEYGTAAYKTVELDTLLDDKPVQHRECQGHESKLFKSYFSELTMMEGGAKSGFREVPAEEYEKRLSRFFKDKSGSVRCKEIPRCRAKVVSGDVYILDEGMMLTQWNGSESSPFERNAASNYLSKVKTKRGDADSQVLDEASISDSHDFYSALDQDENDDGDSDDEDAPEDKKLMRVNVESRDFEDVKEGGVTLDDFKTEDVFILDGGETVFVWIGAGADAKEKKNGIPMAHNYLRESGQPWRPVVVLREGQKNSAFSGALA